MSLCKMAIVNQFKRRSNRWLKNQRNRYLRRQWRDKQQTGKMPMKGWTV